MKTKILLITAVVFALSACDNIATIDIDTTLSKNLEAYVDDNLALGMLNKVKSRTTVGSLGIDFKSAATEGFNFYETDTIDLSENTDLKDRLEHINEMDIFTVSCKLNGIPEGETITELTVFSYNTGLSVTLNNLTENNSSIELEVSAAILKALGEELLQEKVLEVGITGYSSYAPMTLNVELSFDARVEAKLF